MNTLKNQLLSRVIIVIALIVGAITPLVLLNQQPVQAIDDCTPEQWYNCAIQRKDMDRLIQKWCSRGNTFQDPSDASKEIDGRAACQLTLYGRAIGTSPAALASRGYKIEPWCQVGRDPNDEHKSDIPTKCWTVFTKAGANNYWYQAVVDMDNDCADSDPGCENDFIKEFLVDRGWRGQEADSDSIDADLNTDTESAETPFVKRIVRYIRWFSSGLGVLAVFSFIIASIQYTAAGDNAQQVSDAKKRMSNIVIGVLIYVFLFAILQFLVPGGIIGV